MLQQQQLHAEVLPHLNKPSQPQQQQGSNVLVLHSLLVSLRSRTKDAAAGAELQQQHVQLQLQLPNSGPLVSNGTAQQTYHLTPQETPTQGNFGPFASSDHGTQALTSLSQPQTAPMHHTSHHQQQEAAHCSLASQQEATAGPSVLRMIAGLMRRNLVDSSACSGSSTNCWPPAFRRPGTKTPRPEEDCSTAAGVQQQPAKRQRVDSHPHPQPPLPAANQEQQQQQAVPRQAPKPEEPALNHANNAEDAPPAQQQQALLCSHAPPPKVHRSNSGRAYGVCFDWDGSHCPQGCDCSYSHTHWRGIRNTRGAGGRGAAGSPAAGTDAVAAGTEFLRRLQAAYRAGSSAAGRLLQLLIRRHRQQAGHKRPQQPAIQEEPSGLLQEHEPELEHAPTAAPAPAGKGGGMAHPAAPQGALVCSGTERGVNELRPTAPADAPMAPAIQLASPAGTQQLPQQQVLLQSEPATAATPPLRPRICPVPVRSGAAGGIAWQGPAPAAQDPPAAWAGRTVTSGAW